MRTGVLLVLGTGAIVGCVLVLGGGRPISSASGERPFVAVEGQDANIPPARSWMVDINIPPGGDPDDLDGLIDMPSNRVLYDTLLTTPDGWTFTLNSVDGTRWVPVRGGTGTVDGDMTKKPDGSWNMELGGNGDIEGTQFDAMFEGTLFADRNILIGTYTLTGGGSTVTYHINPKSGTATPTYTPTASRTPTRTRTATRTPTVTRTWTATRTATRTVTPPPGAPSATPTRTATRTATLPPGVASATPTRTATATRTYTPTLTGTPTRAATATRGVYGNGDVNKNGTIDSVDALLVLQSTAGELDLGLRAANADVNQDGDVTSVDATIILQYIAGRIDTLPRARPS